MKDSWLEEDGGCGGSGSGGELLEVLALLLFMLFMLMLLLLFNRNFWLDMDSSGGVFEADAELVNLLMLDSEGLCLS